MFDPQMSLLITVLTRVAEALEADPSAPAPWAEAAAALGAADTTRAQEPELASAIDARDLAGLRALLDAWGSGARHLPEQDRGVLKRAMKAFRKSFKVTILDAESSLGGGAFSSGRESSIVAITPPPRYPSEVWQELARQGRLIEERQGTYGLPPE